MMRRDVLTVLLAATLVGCRAQKTAPPGSVGNVAANTSLARANVDKAAALLETHHDDDARKLLDAAIEADPLYGPAHNDLGMIDFRQQHYYEAAVHFRNAVKLLPRQPQPINNLGLVLERSGKLSAAEKYYSQAVGLDPENLEYIGNLARARISLGIKDDQTQQLLVKLVLRDPRNDWVNWARDELRHFNVATQPDTRF